MLTPAFYLIVKGYRLGARKRTMARTTPNIGLDAIIGAIPNMGDVFDLVFKANRRNYELLRRELQQCGTAAPQQRAPGDAV